MSGSWKTFSIPNSSTGTFNGDIMILLTDGSVLVHNGFVSSLSSPINGCGSLPIERQL